MNTRLSFIAFITQRFPLLILVVSLGCLHGCAEYHVTIPDSHPDDINYTGRTMTAWLWGKWYDPQVLAADCQTEGINDVVIKRNYLHDLASVLSFGIFRPIEVHYRCESTGIVGGGDEDFR